MLVLLYFTQRSAGNLQASGFRLLTDNVLDGSEPSRLQHVESSKYGTIARCTVERCPDFTPAPGRYFLAVVCKATRPAKQQHALDLWIEAMQLLPKICHSTRGGYGCQAERHWLCSNDPHRGFASKPLPAKGNAAA